MVGRHPQVSSTMAKEGKNSMQTLEGTHRIIKVGIQGTTPRIGGMVGITKISQVGISLCGQIPLVRMIIYLNS